MNVPSWCTRDAVYAYVLEKDDACRVCASLVGPLDVEAARCEAPQSLRARWATSRIRCAVYSSSTPARAAFDETFFFARAGGDVTGKYPSLAQLAHSEKHKLFEDTLIATANSENEEARAYANDVRLRSATELVGHSSSHSWLFPCSCR